MCGECIPLPHFEGEFSSICLSSIMCITLAVSVSVPTKLKHMKYLKNYLGMNRYKDEQGFNDALPRT